MSLDRGPGHLDGFDEFDIRAMRRALELASTAAEFGEIPVGAVITRSNRILAESFNVRELLEDPTAHAECLAIRLASRALGSWRLEGCTLYATLEPCCMCAGAIVQARIPRLVFAALDPKAGACHSLYRLCDDRRLNHRVRIQHGLLEAPSRQLLREFFQARRPDPSTS